MPRTCQVSPPDSFQPTGRASESIITLTGSEELMRVAWDCGLGETNSVGVAMAETTHSCLNGGRG